LPGIAPSNIYDTQDGMIVVAANQDTIFKRLCTALSMPELVTDKRFATHVARGENQTVLDDIISEWTRARSSADVEAIMVAHAVPVGKVYCAKDMLDDPQYQAREAIVEVPHEKFGTVKMQGVFPKLSKTPGAIRWAGPEALGAHTEEVLAELLDLTPEQIVKLRASGVV
jgi:formyl-CoA transferase